MKDVQKDLKEKICIFCLRHECMNCMNIHKSKKNGIVTYKCINFKKGKIIMEDYKEYLKYSFYDETNSYIAIIEKNTPKEIIEEMKKHFDEVKYSER